MMKSPAILLGQYRPADSFLHNLDARAKLVAIVTTMIFALVTTSMLFYLIAIVALVFGLKLSRIGFGTMARTFVPILLLILLTAIFHLVFSGRGTLVIAEPLGLPIRIGALTAAAFYSLRIMLFMVVAYLITFTCSPSELAEAIVKLAAPLRRLKVPVNDLGLIIFIAIRFIPILYDEFQIIRNAQIMRGADFSGSLITRIRRTSYLLIPVFVAAISRADDLAIAIEARGYDSHAKRTMYSHARIGARETVFMVASAAFVYALFLATESYVGT